MGGQGLALLGIFILLVYLTATHRLEPLIAALKGTGG